MGQITSQTRIVVIKVCNYLRGQYDKEGEDDIVKRTAAATGISVRSIQRIKQQHKRGEMHSPPPRSRKSPVMGALDDFDKDCVRREIMAFYERGEIPTIEKLLDSEEATSEFPCYLYVPSQLVKELGFRYKKVESGRKLLMERNDIVLARNKYLRLIDENQKSDSPRPEIYLDETWLNQNECVGKCWTLPDGIVGPRVKTGKGATFIIVHAGGEYGFVPGGLLFFRSKNGNKGDYHDSMNHTCFLSWFQTQVLVNIPAKSLIVLDNASYHSKILNKAPVSSSRKSDIVSWLANHNIAHDLSYTKTDLLDVVKQHKYLQEYEIDKIARVMLAMKYSDFLLIHCEFNPR
ncbi:uncharacterized protein LOC135225379 [Macrobrachium nipponense]|uniref:uncharacterized protein LOC135225379 n=1 Tax=Macrobrachium nipponense TaxID=159736 RepID=UPI0030C86AB2